MSGDKKTITLYSAATPNGYVATIVLEELGVDYDAKFLSITKNEPKEPWFIEICPNGRIPAIVDNARGGFKCFETSAIALYLAQHYDKENKISFDPVTEPDNYNEMLQWMFFAHGPMQGQSNHFYRYAPEKIPYAINRYINETKRLYSVLEDRLKEGDWLVGGRYSLADIKAMPWVDISTWSGVPLDPFPKVAAWVARCQAREATKRGMSIPHDLKKQFQEQGDKAGDAAREWFKATLAAQQQSQKL